MSCYLSLLSANRLETRGDLSLPRIATGALEIAGAHVGGMLELDGARLTNPAGAALSGDHLRVDHNLICGEGFSAEGEVRLAGADVGGMLVFDGARLTNPGWAALSADGLRGATA